MVASLPPERLLLETDAPWCEIRPTHASARFVTSKHAAKDKKKWEAGFLVKSRNEPCNMRQILEAVAGVKGLDAAALATTVFDNTMKLFFERKD